MIRAHSALFCPFSIKMQNKFAHVAKKVESLYKFIGMRFIINEL